MNGKKLSVDDFFKQRLEKEEFKKICNEILKELQIILINERNDKNNE